MSKIGRKPIALDGVTVAANGSSLTIKGAKAEFTHELPSILEATLSDKEMSLNLTKNNPKNRALWGLHRALIANKVIGASKGFETNIKLVGLGYKGQLSGDKIVFALGYSHKIEYVIPKGITVEIDKTGQNILVKGTDKFEVGNVCDAIRAFKRPEPYKGTGIFRDGDTIIRKAGKTKA